MPHNSLLNFFITIVLLCYPVLVYTTLPFVNANHISICLLAIAILRIIILKQHKSYTSWGTFSIAAAIAIVVYAYNDPFFLRLYPVLMTILMLIVFSLGLFFPPNIIEMLARLKFKHTKMPNHVIQYTKNVTKVWCLFFLFNGVVSTWTIFSSLEIWTFYNGFISYLLMGSLFVSEFLYRHFVVKKRLQKISSNKNE